MGAAVKSSSTGLRCVRASSSTRSTSCRQRISMGASREARKLCTRRSDANVVSALPLAYNRPVETASWFQELKRRRVFRALISYGIVAFAVLQVVEPVMHGLGLPEWVLSATVIALGSGFAVTLVLAWALDLKGGRIERTGPAPSGRLLLVLAVAGLALGAPLVGWYFSRPVGGARAAGAPSIAVLPFADLSPG